MTAASGTALTGREQEVLALVGSHLTNAQIAARLCISVRTAESHVAALLRKMQVSDRRSLARRAATERPATRGGVPVPVTPFVGRVAECAALTRALDEHRVVTAVGPGGIGKSRLALAVATDVAGVRRDGAWFVDLARVTDPAAVVDAVAEAVGVSEQQTGSTETALIGSLARRDGVLVLDNCEHLLDGVRDTVDRIVDGCPAVSVLATSRTRLLLPYEHLYPVPGLSVQGAAGDAIELFNVRVREATGDEPPDPRRIGALCLALDGMALAIELAASRYATLGLDGLEAGLHERLRFFTVGSATAGRHRSLRDTIDWSYDLLDAAEQALLRRVTVFASWFDVDATHAVCGADLSRAAVADGLARLADHSLLVVDRGAATRYRALETIRQYGEERLAAAGELTTMQDQHDHWCRDALRELATMPPDDLWCNRFDGLVDCARAVVVRWAADPERGAAAAGLAAMLADQLWLRGRPVEAQRHYEVAAHLEASPQRRVELLRLAAGAAGTGFAGTEMMRLLRAAADTARAHGDRAGAARDLAWMSLSVSRAPGIMDETRTAEEAADLLAEARANSDGSAGVEAALDVAQAYGDYVDLTVERTEQAVERARAAGEVTLQDAALDLLTAVHLRLNDIPGAVGVVRRRDALNADLAMNATNGFEHSDHCLYGCEILLAAGDLAGAAEYAERLAGLPFNRDEEYLGLARRLLVDAFAGHFDDVLRDAQRFRSSWERDGWPVVPNLASSACAVAMVHGIVGDDQGRAAWSQFTDDLIGGQPAVTRIAWQATFDGILALHRDPAEALELLAIDIDDPTRWWHGGINMWRPWYAAVWAEAAVLADHDSARDRLERARPAVRDNLVAAAMLSRAEAMGNRDREALDGLASTFEALHCPYQRTRTLTLAASL